MTTVGVRVDADWIRDHLTVANLGEFSDDLVPLDDEIDRGPVGTVWGEFDVARQVIRGGVRFALLDCPNALAWTVTTGLPPEPEQVVIHCTINRTEQKPEFIAEIETLVGNLRESLNRLDG